MSWQQIVFYCALTIVPCVFLFNALISMGIYEWFNNKLNGKK